MVGRKRELYRRIVSGVMLTILIISLLTFAFNVQKIKASETVYIHADGSVEGTDKIQRNGNIYTLTDNIYDSIIVQRDNIMVDGAGYTVQGTVAYESRGIVLSYISNVTIKNTQIKKFYYGIHLFCSSNNSVVGNNITANINFGILSASSSNNSISGNNITYNKVGIYLSSSSNNIISGNNITNNGYYGIYLSSNSNNISGNNIKSNWGGIWLHESSNNSISGNNMKSHKWGIWLLYSFNNSIVGNNIIANIWCGVALSDSSNNKFYHNNFINNTQQVHDDAWDWPQDLVPSVNIWDDGYPSGGNYWSDYTGLDVYSGPYENKIGSDGIGDTSKYIYYNNQDWYPLMKPYGGPRDIGVASVTISKTVVEQGTRCLTINIKIINYGVETEAFNITAYANTTVINQTQITLQSRNSTTLTFAWNTSCLAKGKYTIKAVIDTVPEETAIEDNTLTGIVHVTMLGDCYPDGKINIYDLVIVAMAYGTQIGNPDYNSNADLNDDDKININDLRIIAKNYGKTDP